MKNPKRHGDVEAVFAMHGLGIITGPVWREIAERGLDFLATETICEYMDRHGYWPLGGHVGTIASRLAAEDEQWRQKKAGKA